MRGYSTPWLDDEPDFIDFREWASKMTDDELDERMDGRRQRQAHKDRSEAIALAVLALALWVPVIWYVATGLAAA